MLELFKLAGVITMEGLEKAQKGIDSLDKRVKKSIKPLVNYGKQAERVGKQLTMQFTLPIVAAGTAVLAAATKVGNMADELLDLEQMTGLSTDTLQEFKYVAGAAGVDFQGLVNVIGKLTNSLPEIRKGTGPAADAMKVLGINMFDASGNARDMNDLFPEIIKKLQGMKNIAERNAIAQDLFGRTMKDLAPVLGMTSEQLDMYTQKAHENGTVISKEGLVSANDYRIAVDELSKQFTAIWQSLAINVIPILKDDLIPLIQRKVIPFFKSVSEKISDIIKRFTDLPKPVKGFILGLTGMVAIGGPVLILFGKLIGSIQTITTVIGLASVAVRGLSLALSASPWGAVALAVGALAFSLWKAKQAYDDLKEAHSSTLKIITVEESKRKDLSDGIGKLKDMIRALVSEGKNEKEILDTISMATDSLTESAKVLGYELSGNTKQRIEGLDAIKGEIDGLRDATGALIRYKSVTKDANKATIESDEELEEKIKLLEKEISKEEDLLDIMSDKFKALDYEKKKEMDRQKAGSIEFDRIQKHMNDKYVQTLDERLALLERQKQEEIKIAHEHGANIENIEIEFENRKQELIKQNSKKNKELEKQYNDVKIASMYQAFDIFSTINDSILTSLENRHNRERELIESSKLSEEQKEAKLEELDNKYDSNRRSILKRQYVAEKAAALFSIGINTATAYVKALPNLILSKIVLGLGALQAAAVAASPIPEMEFGGVIPATPGGTLVRAGEAGQPEAFIPMETGTKSIADAIISNMRRIGVPRQSNAGPSVHFHIGTLVGDESGLRDFARQIEPILVSETQRRGQ